MYFPKAFLYVFSALSLVDASSVSSSSSIRGSPGPRGGTDIFCPVGSHVGWVTFDMRMNWTPILPGEFVEDIGFGFTMSVSSKEGGLSGVPRIYDSNSVGGHDPDLQVGKGNLLIIQQANTTEPNDNMLGGTITFDFHEKTDVFGIQLVDTEEVTKIRVFTEEGRTVHKPAPVGDGGVEDFVIGQYGVEKMRVKFAGSGAIGNLKICIPDECVVVV